MIAERREEKYRSRRASNQLCRTLLLIDILAPNRRYQTVDEIHAEIVERCGIQVCRRTVFRDLQVLESLNFVEVGQAGYPRLKGGAQPLVYRLNLRSTEQLQAAAIVAADNSQDLLQLREHPCNSFSSTVNRNTNSKPDVQLGCPSSIQFRQHRQDAELQPLLFGER